MPSGTECRACHAKSSKQTSRFDLAKYSHSQEISAEHVWLMCLLCCICHAECIFAEPIRASSIVPGRQRSWSCYKTLTFCSLLARCRIPCACHEKNASTSKTGRCMWCFYHFDFDMIRQYSTCALRHSGVHFFNIPTSKRAPTLRRFLMLLAYFDFEIFCAPQRRALFQHPNFQTSSDTEALFDASCVFWLRNFLCATMACTFSAAQLPKAEAVGFFHFFDFDMCFAPQRRAFFSTSQFPKVLRTRQVFHSFDLECASRHNGVQFFISHLARWLRTRHFSEPPFPQNKERHSDSVIREFSTFSRTCIFFLLTLSLFLIFFLFLFSDFFHVCFFIYRYCRKFDF